MSFETQLKSRLKARLVTDAGNHNASGPTLTAIDKYAGDVAHSVANDVQLSLATDLKTVTEAHDELLTVLASFMTAFAGVVIIPGDGGAATKAACAAFASQIASETISLKTANGTLEGTVATYVG